ncbi:MAG: hypothetical protein ACLPH3_05675 [Terracidiphilus sp.]
MSWNVLIVPEDPTYNGYLLRPLCKRLFREAGKHSANIVVLPEPRVQGYPHAKRLLEDLIPRNWWHFELILFIADADGLADSRKDEFKRLEQLSTQRDRPVKLICCAAEQELETWLLSGHQEKLKDLGWRWPEIRAEVSVKERFFQPFLDRHGDSATPSQGRERLMQEALANFAGMKSRCDELQELENRIRAHVVSIS